MVGLRAKIEQNFKNSLKKKNEIEINALRLIKSAIKNKDIALRSEGNKSGLSDEGILILLQSLIKQRNESIEMFKKGGKEHLVLVELKEIEVIKNFLPIQLNEEDIKKIIKNIIQDQNLNSIKDMGKIMNLLKSKYSGKIDMSIASKFTKEILN